MSSTSDPSVCISSVHEPFYPIEIGYWRDIQKDTENGDNAYPLPYDMVDKEWWTTTPMNETGTSTPEEESGTNENEGRRLVTEGNEPSSSFSSTTTLASSPSSVSSFDAFVRYYSLPTLCLYYIQSRFLESYEFAPSYCRFPSCSSGSSTIVGTKEKTKTSTNLEQRYKDLGCCTFTDGIYIWPEGYGHYLQQHYVRPPSSFLHHVLGVYEYFYKQYYQAQPPSSVARPSSLPHYTTLLPCLSLLQYDINGTKECFPVPTATIDYLVASHVTVAFTDYLQLSTTRALYTNPEGRQKLLEQGTEFLKISQTVYTSFRRLMNK